MTIFDKEVLFAEDLAYDTVGREIYLGPPASNPAGPGAGKPIAIQMTGKDLAAAGDAYVEIEGSNDGTNWGFEQRQGIGPQAANDQGIIFFLSSVCSRYIRVSLVDFNAGTWTCGVVINE